VHKVLDGRDGLWGEVPQYGLLPGELRSGSRRREAVMARGEIALGAVRELGYSGAEVARYLGVTTSCINRVVGQRGEEEGRRKMEANEKRGEKGEERREQKIEA